MKFSRRTFVVSLALSLAPASCGEKTPANPGGVETTRTGGSGGSASGGSMGAASGGSGGGAASTGGAGVGGTGGATPASTGGAGGETSSDTAPGTGGTTDTGGPAPDAGAEVPASNPSGPQKQWSCPAGPFETPKAGTRKGICGPLLKYNWSEGPTWIASQKAFFFSNFPVGQARPGDILKYTPADDKCETWVEGAACNGLGVAPDGNLLAPCQGPRALMKYDVVTKQATVVLDKVDGQLLDSPNDVIAHSNGTLYFTNPSYELAGRPRGLGPSAVRIDPMGKVSVIVRGGINGIGLSPDEKRLYIGQQGVWDLDDAGVPVKKAGGFPTGGDGFAIDCAGNLYNQGGAIVNPQGQTIGNVPGGTNMAFGGVEGKTLLIVRGKSAQLVEMSVPGLP